MGVLIFILNYVLQVDDINAAMKDLKEHNIRALSPEPRVSSCNIKYCLQIILLIPTTVQSCFSENNCSAPILYNGSPISRIS